MNATYYVEFKARCPNDPEVEDDYQCTINSDRMIQVEELKEVIAELTKRPVYQEDLTVFLAARLQATVKLAGEHQGVWIESVHEGGAQAPKAPMRWVEGSDMAKSTTL